MQTPTSDHLPAGSTMMMLLLVLLTLLFAACAQLDDDGGDTSFDNGNGISDGRGDGDAEGGNDSDAGGDGGDGSEPGADDGGNDEPGGNDGEPGDNDNEPGADDGEPGDNDNESGADDGEPGGNDDEPGNDGGDGGEPGGGAGGDEDDDGPPEVTVSVSDLKYTGYGEPLQGQSYTVTFRWTTGVEGADTLTCQLDLGDDTPARFIRDSCLGAQQVTHTYDALAETTFVDLLVSHDGVSELRSVTISAQPSKEPDPADEREHWLQLINLARSSPQRCGDIEMPAVAPLSWDDRLGRAAQLHSEYMAETGSFSHTGRDGSHLGNRLIDQGYLYSYGSENIALGQPFYEIAMDGWLNSPGHCANIMSPRVVHVGVGMARSATGVPFWTQDFASPR